MNVDKYLKYANYHYPYYDWRIYDWRTEFDDECKEIVIRVRYTFDSRLGLQDGFQGLVPIYSDVITNESYYDKTIKNLIKKLAKEMKIFARGKKNAKS